MDSTKIDISEQEDENSSESFVSTDSDCVEIPDDSSRTVIVIDSDESIEGIENAEGPPSNSNSDLDISLGQSTKQRECVKSTAKNYEMSNHNQCLKSTQLTCKYCTFKTESEIVFAQHMDTPHVVYSCNSCEFKTGNNRESLIHMDRMHSVLNRPERAPAHLCPYCLFKGNSMSTLVRHLSTCAEKSKVLHNLSPPMDLEPPTKIQKITEGRPTSDIQGTSAYMTVAFVRPQPIINPMVRSPMPATLASPMYTIPPLAGGSIVRGSSILQQKAAAHAEALAAAKAAAKVAAEKKVAAQEAFRAAMAAKAVAKATEGEVVKRNYPSISITALPIGSAPVVSYVICEICDENINVQHLLNHLKRNHFMKLPSNLEDCDTNCCMKCQYTYYTNFGLERHLLATHGLVTGSFENSDNYHINGGKCPVCGKLFGRNMLSHLVEDHSMTLKYRQRPNRCTICSISFRTPQEFNRHMCSAHNFVGSRVVDQVTELQEIQVIELQDSDMPTGLNIND